MAFDLTLPADGVTKFSELYAALRDNFNGIYNLIVTSWTTVSSFGTNWSGTSVAYIKNYYGFVTIRGYVTASGVASSTVFTLPAGFRPGYARKYIVVSASSTARPSAVLTINTDGTVVSGLTASGTRVYFCLDVSFKNGA